MLKMHTRYKVVTKDAQKPYRDFHPIYSFIVYFYTTPNLTYPKHTGKKSA